MLVAHPPGAGTLTGRIELLLDGVAVGAVTLTCCPVYRTATLDYVHVAAEHRRLGYGRTLVAAAHARAPGYTWGAPLPDGTVARAFRARIRYPSAGAPCVGTVPRSVFPARHAGLRSGGMGTVSDDIGACESTQE